MAQRLGIRGSGWLTVAGTLAGALGCGAASLTAQEMSRVSVASSGVEADGASHGVALSADGRIVAFASSATQLVVGDGNDLSDIFVVDRTLGTIERVSVDSAGNEANGACDSPALSADGDVVAFRSVATNLVASDSNGKSDIFVHVRSTGATTRVSVVCNCVQGNGDAFAPALSADGSLVAFATDNSQLIGGDTNGVRDVFVHDRTSGLSRRVSLDSTGAQANGASDRPALSADGRFVAFESVASNLVAGDGNALADLFVHDRTTGVTERASIDSGGGDADGASEGASLSGDGRFVAFASRASDLVAGDGNAFRDCFLRDRLAGTTQRVSLDLGGGDPDGESYGAVLAADATHVAFVSRASDLAVGDANGVADLFVRDLASGAIERASRSDAGSEADGASGEPGSGGQAVALSADGNSVAFHSSATNLVPLDGNGVEDAFVRDRCVLARATSYGSGFPGALGEPTVVATTLPQLGTTCVVELQSSAIATQLGVVLLGDTAVAIPFKKGGELLLLPLVALALPLDPGVTTLAEDVPDDGALCGVVVRVQLLQLDPGALQGQATSAALELRIGTEAAGVAAGAWRRGASVTIGRWRHASEGGEALPRTVAGARADFAASQARRARDSWGTATPGGSLDGPSFDPISLACPAARRDGTPATRPIARSERRRPMGGRDGDHLRRPAGARGQRAGPVREARRLRFAAFGELPARRSDRGRGWSPLRHHRRRRRAGLHERDLEQCARWQRFRRPLSIDAERGE